MRLPSIPKTLAIIQIAPINPLQPPCEMFPSFPGKSSLVCPADYDPCIHTHWNDFDGITDLIICYTNTFHRSQQRNFEEKIVQFHIREEMKFFKIIWRLMNIHWFRLNFSLIKMWCIKIIINVMNNKSDLNFWWKNNLDVERSGKVPL